ncbi:MAG: hypothetical protein ACRCXT_00840 [Paraclostridium sp.]
MENVINILGEEYKLLYQEQLRYDNCDGYTDWTKKEIGIIKLDRDDDKALGDISIYERKVLKHEIIHAFLDQSGLMGSSDWVRNEEMIDFFAIQWDKINKAMEKSDKILCKLQEE